MITNLVSQINKKTNVGNIRFLTLNITAIKSQQQDNIKKHLTNNDVNKCKSSDTYTDI